MKEPTIYMGWKLFQNIQKRFASYKKILVHVMDRLIGNEKRVTVELPDRGIVTLTAPPEKSRSIIHLLFAHTTLRGEFELQGEVHRIEVIEDLLPVHDISLKVKEDKIINKVYLAPSKGR